jgi:multidrug efflux pump
MDIASLSVRRPVLAIVMSVLILLFGAIGYNYLGVREFPSIDPPVITVRTSYTGANADVIQSQITEPLEKVINGIDGIRSISASSNQGSSNITVEFNLGADLEAAANDVRDKVSRALRQLPQDIDAPPVVSKADANSDAIVSMTLLSDTRSLLEVSDYAENVIAQNLQTISGVSLVQIWGQRRFAMRIRLHPDKLAAYNLTPLDVKLALDRENVDLPSGKISGNATELTVNTIGRLSTVPEFEAMIIKEDASNIVRLRDVAKVELGAENEETILKNSGVPMVGLALVPQPGANYIDISDEFYRRYELLKKELPKDYHINIALDNTRFIKKSIVEVQETLIIALVLVIFIIFLFFRDWVIAFRPLIDIPVSLVGAFFIMYLMDYSINVLTLLAIVLATGLVVDDGIVVTENIFKKIEKGMNPTDAAIEGTREIYTAVIITSLTLVAVFMPVIFLEGFVGRLFREFGVVLAGAVLISAFVSLTLTPMLNAKLIRKDPTKKGKFFHLTEPFFVALDAWFKKTVTHFLQKRWWAVIILFISFGAIYYFGSQLQSELSPLEDRNWLRMMVTTPEGTSYEVTDDLMDKVADFISDSVPEKQVCLTVTAPSFAGSGAVNTGFGRLALTESDKRNRSQAEIASYLTKNLSQFPEGRVFIIQEQSISSGGGPRGTLPVAFVLQTQNFEKLREKLPLFLEQANKNPTFGGLVDVNLKFNKPELVIEINRDKARTMGISIADVAQTIQLALSGQRFGYYIQGDKQYQVVGQVNREKRDDPNDIKELFVRNNKGEMVQLDNIITIEERSSPPQLYHYNRYQSATITAGLAPGKTIGDGIIEMNKIAAEVLDDSFTTSLTGASRDFAESSSNIFFAFGLALVLIYLLLAAQFESFVSPIIIICTVPMALAGAFFSLWYFNQTLNIFSQIGMIMLIGLVTKNGILIIEFYDQLREKGLTVRRAMLQAATARMRPILMTSLATMLGAMPIALALGAGSKSRMGMGIVIIGGLLLSMVLTLFVIPALVVFTFQIKTFFSRYFRKRHVDVSAKAALLLVFGSLSYFGQAQDQLSLEEAIKLGLEKNYSILIVKNQKEIAKAQNNFGNAGMSPTVSLNANLNLASLNSHQEFNTGVVQDRTGAQSNNTGASLNATWNVFDGLKMFAIKKRLDMNEELSTIQLKQQMEQTVYDIIVTYHNVVRTNELLKAAKQNLNIYEERLKIAQLKLEIGSDSKVDVLLTRSDENKAKSAIIQLELELMNSKVQLNNLLAKPADTDFITTDSIVVNYNPNLEDLKKTVTQSNTSLLYSKQNELIFSQGVKEARAANLPLVQLSGAYVFTRNTSQAGIIFLNRQNGLNGGLTASWLIFNGNKNKRLVQERNILALNQRYLTEQTQIQIDGLVYVSYKSFLLNKQIVTMELQNLADSKEVQTISLERYKIGKANLLETIETQKNLEDAQVRYINALYAIKVAETELLRVNGTLVK